jgi:CBS domain-containing protein
MNCPSCGHENIEGNDRCENCLAPFRDLDVPRADSAEGLARSVMEDNLSELDQDETICVAPDTPTLEVARLMKNSNSGCALVVDGGKLIGIFTEHDVLLKMTGEAPAEGNSGKLPFVEPVIIDHTGDKDKSANLVEEMQAQSDRSDVNETLVKQVMTTNPEVLDETDSVAEALNKMSLGRFRHIPFRKSDGSFAVASIKSVLKYIAQEDW